MTNIWQTKLNKEQLRDLPIIIPLVIYHGKGNWIAAKSLGNMVTGYHLFPKELKKYVPDFEYVLFDLTSLSDEEIKGSVQLKVYLTICRDILTDDITKFMSSIFRALDYLLEIEDKRTRISYLKVLMTYIFSAGRNLTQKEVKQVIKKIPEGSEIVMTLADRYRKEGEKIGIEKGILKVARELIKKGLSIKDIAEVTGLHEQEIERIQKELQE